MNRRSINLPLDIHDLVALIKQEYEAKNEQKYTYPAIIFMLCQYYLNNESDIEVRRVKDTQQELEETNAFIREAFMKMIDNQKSQPMYVVANNTAAPITLINEQQPEKKTLTEEQIKTLREQSLVEGKTFVKEMDTIIAEAGTLSPSLVASINECASPSETPEQYKERREQEKKLVKVPPGLTPPPM